MKIEEYLAARIGRIIIGMSCNDVLNVYHQAFKVARMVDQGPIYLGITRIGSDIMPVVDLRRRARVRNGEESGPHHIITFQTSLTKKLAVVVDEIIGMKSIDMDKLQKPDASASNQFQNINLLFPMVTVMDDGSIIHIMDSTYLEKLDPIAEESGDLEFF
jgi:chemotaxis signal transduction protein